MSSGPPAHRDTSGRRPPFDCHSPLGLYRIAGIFSLSHRVYAEKTSGAHLSIWGLREGTLSSYKDHACQRPDYISTQILSKQLDMSFKFPKMHSLSHYVNFIRRKGPCDGYFTDIGEGQHPQTKADYARTNEQSNFHHQVSTNLVELKWNGHAEVIADD